MYKQILIAAAAISLVACGGDSTDTPSTSADASQAPQGKAPGDASVPASVEVSAAPDKAALTADAKAAAMALGSSLKSQLQAAMKAGGPTEAVAVCHKIAPAVASSLSAQHGVTLTRVSLKNRNPEMGVPNDWQTAVLQDFEARKLAGEAPDQLAYSEIVDGEHRFMKAIPTAKVCLTCHGTDVKPEVKAKIDEFYPEDRATGYAEGDIRGAFVVVRSLAAAE